MLNVLVITPQEVLYEGPATGIILPGEQGVFEILEHHKRLISRLFTGNVTIDDKTFSIRRGMVTVEEDKVTIVIENLSE